MKKFHYLALRPAESDLLDIELGLRISMAIFTEHAGIPFVHTPIQTVQGFSKSKYSWDVLDQKWARYFSLLAKDFLSHQADGKCIYLNENLRHLRTIVTVRSPILDEMQPHYLIQPLLKDFYYTSKIFNRRQYANILPPIDTQEILAFAARSHSAYMQAFGLKSRAPFEDNILRATFMLNDDGLKTPFFYELLLPLADFVEEQARKIGCKAEIKLFTSFKTDTPQTAAFDKKHEEILTLLRSRPGISHCEKPLFEEVIDAAVTADFLWISGALYARTFIRNFLFFLSRPGQIGLETVNCSGQLNINKCFLMWDGKRFTYERGKMDAYLENAGKENLSDNGYRKTAGISRLLILLSQKKRPPKVALGIVDGIGSYITKDFVLQSVADHYGFPYVHVPPLHLDHNHDGEPGWAQKWRDFFMIGEGYPHVDEVFEDGPENIDYFYNLPDSEVMHSMRYESSHLVVCSMADYWVWPVPDDILAAKISKVRDAFQKKHEGIQDQFSAGKLNVAVHVRKQHDRTLPMQVGYGSINETFAQERVFTYTLDRLDALYKTMEQLGVPFRMHIYSDMLRQDAQPLLEIGDMQLHLAEESKDQALDFLEMSRADVFMLAPSRTSYLSALFAKPNQLQIVTQSYENDLIRLMNIRKAVYTEDIETLHDTHFMEECLKQRNLL